LFLSIAYITFSPIAPPDTLLLCVV
jgi:hypothetical protein